MNAARAALDGATFRVQRAGTMPKPPESDPPDPALQRRFGRNFRAMRRELGLTQVQVARLVGIVQSEISEIENGAVNLTAQRMESLARAIGCEVDVLLTRRT